MLGEEGNFAFTCNNYWKLKTLILIRGPGPEEFYIFILQYLQSCISRRDFNCLSQQRIIKSNKTRKYLSCNNLICKVQIITKEGLVITVDWIIQYNQKYLFPKNVVRTQKDVY